MTRPYAFDSLILPGLAKLLEEGGETVDVLSLMQAIGRVMQVGGKLIMTGGEPNHWDGTNLHTRIEEEVSDLEAIIRFIRLKWAFLDNDFMEARIRSKMVLFEQWHKLGEDRSLPNG